MQATLTFLGSGTSMGVPTLGCPCAVCRDAMQPGSKNRRTRPSVRLEYGGHVVLIDTGPDFHAQALRENLARVDAVFYTHHHADHILGMDDLRPLTFKNPGDLPLYADEATAAVIRNVFSYTFRTVDRYPTSARVKLMPLPTEPGAAVTLFGTLCWTSASVLSRHTTIGLSGFAAAGWEMLFAGLFNTAIMFSQGGYKGAHWGTQAYLSILYLVVFGSLVTYTAYIYLLDHVPVAKVATYAYINPIVAVVLGALLLHERMVPIEYAGMAAILVAVYLVTSSKLKTATVAPEEELEAIA